MEQTLQPNKGKQLAVEINGESFARYPIRTHVVTPGEDLMKIIKY